MAQKGFFYDMTVCAACRTCMVACKNTGDLDVGVTPRRVYSFEGGRFPNPWVFHISMGCNHCADPSCLRVCAPGAIYKREEDGLVLLDPDRCDGCRLCEKGCPYSSISFDAVRNVVAKCDGCVELLDAGEEPACVQSCTMRALDFGEIELLREQYGGTASIRFLPAPSQTQPSLTIRPKPMALGVG